MTLKIEILVPDEADASAYIERSLSALGFTRSYNVATNPQWRGALTAEQYKAAMTPLREADSGGLNAEEFADPLEELSDEGVIDEAPKRQRGQPSPGKARRTKAEIEEDRLADEEDQAVEVGDDATVGLAAISSGEERIDPNAAQDAADEAAETAANRKSDAPTLDDLRLLMGAVAKKHGMAVATTLPELIGKNAADLTDEELPAAIAKVHGVLDGKDQTPVEAKPAEPTATKQDVIAAMLRYALKFDGQNTDMQNMPATMEDAPKAFGMLFGKDVQTVSQIPADPVSYGKAVAGIDEMTTKNPFKRTAK